MSTIVHNPRWSDYAVLNAGVVAVAWFRAWRVLNLLGALGQRHLRAPSQMPSAVCSEEVLILGMQNPTGFQRVAGALS